MFDEIYYTYLSVYACASSLDTAQLPVIWPGQVDESGFIDHTRTVLSALWKATRVSDSAVSGNLLLWEILTDILAWISQHVQWFIRDMTIHTPLWKSNRNFFSESNLIKIIRYQYIVFDMY